MLNIVIERLQKHFIHKNFVQIQRTAILKPNDVYITLTRSQDVCHIKTGKSIIFDLFHNVIRNSVQISKSQITTEFLNHVAVKLADEASELEMKYLLKIINYIFNMTEDVVIVNNIENIDNYFKCYVCNYKTRLNTMNIHDLNINIIRCDTIEPGIILAIDKLDGFLINNVQLNNDLDIRNDSVNITLHSEFALLIKQPQHVVKFIDKEVYDKLNLTKFKWLINGEENEQKD